MTNFDPLDAPEVREWREGFTHPPGLLETVAHCVGFAPIMVALRFLSPKFVETDGCILLPWEYSPETFAGWWDRLSEVHFSNEENDYGPTVSIKSV